MRFALSVLAIFSLSCLAMGSETHNAPKDPLQSSQWETMYSLYLKDLPVVFDPRVKVLAPEAAENSLEVPVMVIIESLNDIQEVLVFADYNPLPKVLKFVPIKSEPIIGFRIKLQQASPIRAAVRTGESRWLVGGVWVDAAGGGCTLPSVGSANSQWESRLGEVSARMWPRVGGKQRLRFSMVHPMDTGLAPGVPPFYMESIDLSDDKGEPLAIIKPYEPVSENPIFSLDMSLQTKIILSARDNNGNRFRAAIIP